jgi:FkbM family methyltransferase
MGNLKVKVKSSRVVLVIASWLALLMAHGVLGSAATLEAHFRQAGIAPDLALKHLQPEALRDPSFGGDNRGFWVALPSKELPDTYPGVNVIRTLGDRGSWAVQETAVMAAIIATHVGYFGCHMFDVGAHIGYFGLMAASLGCSVTAVEPNPLHAALIRVAADTGGTGHRVKVIGRVVTNDPATHIAFDGFRIVENYSAPVAGTAGIGDVAPTVSLSELLLQQGSALFMKVDVEGHEASMLRSANAAELAHVGHIYIEVTTHSSVGAAGVPTLLKSSLQTAAYLRSAGFVLYTNMWMFSDDGRKGLPSVARAVYPGDNLWSILWRIPEDSSQFNLAESLNRFAAQVGCVENHGICQIDVWAVQVRTT